MSGTISSATLRLEHEAYFGHHATETFDVFDVSTSAALIANDYSAGNATGQSIYADLGTGNTYATNIVGSPSTVGTIFEIPLNGQALADISGAFGDTFAVGLRLREPFTSLTGIEGIRFNKNIEFRTHELVLGFGAAVPEPSTIAMTLIGLGGLLAVGRAHRKNRRAA